MKGLVRLSEKTQLTSAGKVRSFPVLGSLSVSWSSSRGNAGILTTRSSCSKQQNKSTGCVLQGQSTKSLTKEITALPKHTFRVWKYIYTDQFIHHPNAKPPGNTREPPAHGSEETWKAVLDFRTWSLLRGHRHLPGQEKTFGDIVLYRNLTFKPGS